MNDGEKSVKLYSDDKNMMMSKMKYHENKDMVSMMVIVARTYCDASYVPLSLAHRQQWVRGLQ